ncbi:hypothetical protein [Vulcanisaeta sp. JCM 16161]
MDSPTTSTADGDGAITYSIEGRRAMRTAPSPRHALGKNHPTNAHSTT